MGNLKKEQQEVLALIDSILAMTEKLPTDKMSLNVSLNPIDYLVSIITKEVPYEDLIKWLSKTLVYTLPIIELGVKGVLLSNLKKTIDCNNDPRIPNKLRKAKYRFSPDELVFPDGERDGYDKRGFLIPISSIDYMNILTVSPLSAMGYMYYFGTKSYYIIDGYPLKKYHYYIDAVNDCGKYGFSVNRIIDKSEVENVYELARARDFNAFLWFVIHKAQFRFPKEINFESENFGVKNNLGVFSKENEKKEDVSMVMPFVPPYMPGDVIHQEKSYVMSLCFKMKKRKNLALTKNALGDVMVADPMPSAVNSMASVTGCVNTFVPVSCDNFSANWYVDRKKYFDFLSPWKDKKRAQEEEENGRDFSNEFAICNLQYVNRIVEGTNVSGNLLRFTILPKPYVYVPRLIRILFDSNGIPDRKGKYSILVVEEIKRDDEDIAKFSTSDKDIILCINKKTREYWIENSVGDIPGDGNFQDGKLSSVLYECYPGLTVYEFNYDFVMGMKLFDPVIVATRLISMVTNMRFGDISLGIDKTETPYKMRISEVIKKIIESNAYEVSDCFYTFDNAEYDKMIRDSEMKRAKLYPFNQNGNDIARAASSAKEIEKILNEYDENATLQENEEVITRAITQATASVTDEVLPKDKYSIKCNIIIEMVKSFANILIEAVLTPKVLILFEVNRKLMGAKDEPFRLEDLMEAMFGVINGIIREIIDLIIKELLDWVLKILADLAMKLSTLLVKEQLEYYTRLIKQLLEACVFRTNHRKALQSKLDVVDYADIDEIDRPKESNC